jgi:hypothetical protein
MKTIERIRNIEEKAHLPPWSCLFYEISSTDVGIKLFCPVLGKRNSPWVGGEGRRRISDQRTGVWADSLLVYTLGAKLQ